MPDLRYHLISLISVFLALTIGILLGVAMSDRGVISDRLQAEITDVRDRLNKQQAEIDQRDREIGRLKERTETERQMSQRMSETMTAEKLADVNVALVSGPWVGDPAVQSVENALSTSGANFTSNIRLQPLDAAETPSLETTAELTTANSGTLQANGAYADEALEVLAGGSSDSGSPGSDSPQVIVFVGGGEIPPDAPSGTRDALRDAEREMLQTWLDAGVEVIGAQSSASPRSEVDLYKEVGISSADNADQPAGQATIILLAAGEAPEGSYGVKGTASSLFPPAPS